jgi:type I restriction enzyme S subunit
MTDVNKLITDNIDVWTSAIKKRNSQGRGSNKKIELTGIKKLRELILELAVSGKLIPQDPTDESASVLLTKLAREKAKLIKDKVIRKSKALPKICSNEKTLDLPFGWAWERFDNIYDVRDGTHDSPKAQTEGYPLITSKNLYTGVLDMTNAKYISETDHLKIIERSRVERNDILFAMIGSIGNPVIVDVDEPFSIKNVALFKYFDSSSSVPAYLRYFLKLAAEIMKKQSTGGVQAFVSLGKLRSFVMAVPPLAEQHRIVAKVDELMALCDQLEQQTEQSLSAHKTLVEVLLAALTNCDSTEDFQTSWQRIAEHFDVLFTTENSIEQLKQTILQLAVMGKLVPQNPSDEPASVLLEKIGEEKAQLIADKKIKKQKSLPAITDEEKPFEIPEGWEWCRLPDLGDLARGKSKHRPRNDPKLYANGTIPLIQTGDVARSTEFIETYTALYNETGLAQSHLWPKGTLCITIAANIADTGILGFDACFPDSVVGYTPFESQIPTKYFDYFIRTAKANLEKFAPSTAQKNINLEILGQVLVPCPPLNEFVKIVERIDSLMSLCEQLKARLSDAQTTQLHLADAVVENALT